MSIDSCISERGITSVYHFTPQSALIEIVIAGEVRSREALESSSEWQEGCLFDFITPPDQLRLDDFRAYINTSVTRPNIYLLRQFRDRLREVVDVWCILEFGSEVLKQSGAIFSVTNAASAASRSYGIQGGESGLRNLFRAEVVTEQGRWTRKGKATSEPTDVQAEALLPGPIPTTAIRAVHFEDKESLVRCMSALAILQLPSWKDKAFISPNLFC